MELKFHVEKILARINETLEEKNKHLLAGENEKQETSEIIRSCLRELPEQLQKRTSAEFFGSGPLEELIQDSSITEIMISPESIHFEQNGSIHNHKDHFQSPFTQDRFFNRLYDEIGRHPTLVNPFVDGTWKGFRVHLVRNPVCGQPFHLTLRRHSGNQWELNDLLENQMLTRESMEILKTSFQARENLLIAGTTGSGKTTLINSLILNSGDRERLIIIEDTDELVRPNTASVKLLTRPESSELSEINQQTLLVQSLRMRPDRILVGEVRGPEAKDLLLTLSTGHAGFLGSLHANSSHEALWRLEMLIQMGAPEWSLDTIRKLIHVSLDKIVVTERYNKKRRIREIMRLSGIEHHGFLLEPEFQVNNLNTHIQIGSRRNII